MPDLLEQGWGGLMKKNWIFVILSIAMLFSLGFLPAPSKNTVNSGLASTSAVSIELIVVNRAKAKLIISVSGLQPYFQTNFYVQKGTSVIQTINIKPGNYKVYANCIYPGRPYSPRMVKNITVTSKTKTIKVSFSCSKVK
jgi:hypothetical protein